MNVVVSNTTEPTSSFSSFAPTAAENPNITRGPAILSLPSEILEGIFCFLRSVDSRESASHNADCSKKVQDIKSVRLTCKQFYETSSRFLIRSSTVDTSKLKTLSRLECISCHALIRMGVKEIKIISQYYSPRLATDIDKFMEFSAYCLFENSYRWGGGTSRERATLANLSRRRIYF